MTAPTPADLVDPFVGIADGCRLLPRDPGAPAVYQVTVRMADTRPYLGLRGDTYNSGAGLDAETARGAGIGEAVERYCLSSVAPERMVFGTAESLATEGRAPLRHDETALFDPSQEIPSPRQHFQGDTPLNWLPAVSLLTGQERLVPACLVNIPYAPLRDDEQLIAPSISTGSACGRSRFEAMRNGLLECIERDAVAILWRNRLAPRRLILDEEECSGLFDDSFRRPNLNYHLFEISLDMPVPTVISLIEDRNYDPPLFAIGGASRLDIRAALTKALIESVQGWAWARFWRVGEGAVETPPYQTVDGFEAHVRLYACCDMREALAFMLRSPEVTRLSSWPVEPTRTEEQEVRRLVEAIRPTGGDVLAVDMTTEEVRELGLCVIRIFCPHFEQVEGDHNFPLLGGRRWRDVPVQTGRLPRVPDLDQRNPHPHPYP